MSRTKHTSTNGRRQSYDANRKLPLLNSKAAKTKTTKFPKVTSKAAASSKNITASAQLMVEHHEQTGEKFPTLHQTQQKRLRLFTESVWIMWFVNTWERASFGISQRNSTRIWLFCTQKVKEKIEREKYFFLESHRILLIGYFLCENITLIMKRTLATC